MVGLVLGSEGMMTMPISLEPVLEEYEKGEWFDVVDSLGMNFLER